MDKCNRIFERIYTGEIPDQVTFKSTDPEHPVFAVLALKQATRGHTIITSTECTPSLDLVSPKTHNNISLVSRATGLWLQAAFEPGYVGALVAGVSVPHAHVHRIPRYEGRDWLHVLGAADPQPFVRMSNDEQAEVYARATFATEYAAAVQRGLTTGQEVQPAEMLEMAYDLRTSPPAGEYK
jgi:histidine triad (HIT) family protein